MEPDQGTWPQLPELSERRLWDTEVCGPVCNLDPTLTAVLLRKVLQQVKQLEIKNGV